MNTSKQPHGRSGRAPLRASSSATHLAVLVLTIALTGALSLAASISAQEAISGPRIVLPEPVIDIGSVSRGTLATATFTIENAGTEPLELTSLRTTCACAAGEFDQVIAPGSTGKFTLEIDTSMLAGQSTTQATLGTNDPENPSVTLTARLNSKSYLSVEPGYLRYDVHQNFPGEGSIEQSVWSDDGAEFEITGLRTELRVGNREVASSGTFRPAEDSERRANISGSQWKVDFQLPKDTPVGAITGWLRIDTTHPEQKTAHLPITGFVRPVVAVTPPQPKYQFVKTKLAEEKFEHRLHVKNFAGDGMTITDIDLDVEGVNVSQETLVDGHEFHVILEFTGEMNAGEYQSDLVIVTDNEATGTITVPLRFHVEP